MVDAEYRMKGLPVARFGRPNRIPDYSTSSRHRSAYPHLDLLVATTRLRAHILEHWDLPIDGQRQRGQRCLLPQLQSQISLRRPSFSRGFRLSNLEVMLLKKDYRPTLVDQGSSLSSVVHVLFDCEEKNPLCTIRGQIRIIMTNYLSLSSGRDKLGSRLQDNYSGSIKRNR